MLKLIRKNKQWLFAVLMIFLAIAFLVPNMGNGQGGGISTETVAKIGDEKVNAFQIARADAEYAVLKETFGPQMLQVVSGINISNGTHWYLLTHEAEESGFVGNDADGREWLEQLAQEMAPARLQSDQRFFAAVVRQVPEVMEAIQRNPMLLQSQSGLMQIMSHPQIAGLAVQAEGANLMQASQNAANRLMSSPALKFDSTSFDTTLAKLRGVRRMVNAFLEAPRVSDRRLMVAASERLNEAVASYVVIPAARLVDTTVQPTAEELAPFFEKYKGDIAGMTNPSNDFGFGYRQPPRIKLEYMTVSKDLIAATVKADPVAAYTKWKNNRAIYAKEFADEKQRVEDDMKNDQVKTIMNDAEKIVRAEVQKATKKLNESGGYRVIPANWSEIRPPLESIAKLVREQIKAIHGVDIQEPLVTLKTGSWLNRTDVKELPGIGQAGITIAGQNYPFYAIAFTAKELGGPANEWALQQGVTYPTDKTLQDPAGNRYYFTILESKPEAAAESIDEVREDVVRDFRIMKAYEKLVAEAPAYRTRAINEGLIALAKSFEKPNPDPAALTPLEPGLNVVPLSSVRKIRTITAQGQEKASIDTEAFRSAILGAAAKMDPKAEPIKGENAKGEALADRFVTCPLPEERSLAIMYVIANRPLTGDLYRGLMESESRELVTREYRPVETGKKVENPYRWSVIKGRLNYRPVKEDTRVEQEDVEDTGTPAPAAGKPGQ